MELKRLLSLVRQAVDKYEMIDKGDRVAVGISGGKDSVTLLYALNELSKFYPKKFSVEAVTVDVGAGMDFSPVSKLCDEIGVRYTIVETKIKQIVFDEVKEKNPCSLCAKMRKGALNDKLNELGCNKIAYGHHKDDFVNTALLSMIYEGRYYGLEPTTYLDKSGLTLIRPLMYVNESDIIGFINKCNMCDKSIDKNKTLKTLPVIINNCPADGSTKREYVSELTKTINRENKGARDRMFNAWIKEYEIIKK